ncbi:MAG: ParB/RepB/Spo0J family partition protein [Vicinamibacterales bacterium]
MPEFDSESVLRHPLTPEREGLPPSYRMRADAHYVDQLTSRSPDVPVRLVAVEEIDEPEAESPADAADLRPLVQSIAEHGVVQPLLVVRDGSRYRLIAGRNRLAAARVASLTRVPCLVHQVDEVQADVLARATQVRAAAPRIAAPVAAPVATASNRSHADTVVHVAEAVAAIRAAAAMLAGDISPMTRRVALDLVRAEAWRASWQLRTAAILEGIHEWRFKSLPLGYLVRQACEGFSSESRLRSIDLKVNLVDGDPLADLDEGALICGVTGAVMAVSGLLGSVDASQQVTLTVRRWPGEALAVEIAQDVVSPAAGVADRFFDRTWSDRPGGWNATIGAAVAQAVAEHHGGEAAFLTDSRGSTVRLTLHSTSPTRQ